MRYSADEAPPWTYANAICKCAEDVVLYTESSTDGGESFSLCIHIPSPPLYGSSSEYYYWDGGYVNYDALHFKTKAAALAFRDKHFDEWNERTKAERLLFLL